MTRIRQISLTICLQAICLTAAGQNWPAFRGTNAAGTAPEAQAPTHWDVNKGQAVAWKTKLPGLGHSSPIVWGQQVFVTTAVSSDPNSIYSLETSGKVDRRTDKSKHQWKVICLDLQTGKRVWEKIAHEGVPRIHRHPKNSYASATPATDGKHLVASFGSQGLVCYSLDGQLLWKQDLGVIDAGASYDDTYDWGIGSSPIIFRNLVIVQADAQKDSYLAAFELTTGKPVWRVSRDLISSFSTPTIFEHPNGVELICNGAEQMRAYAPLTGKELWRLSGSSKNTTPTPVVGHGLVFIASGYRAQPIFAVRPGAVGDLTTAADTPPHKAIAWNSDRGGPYMTTPLVHNQNLYILRRGILSCYQATTGERLYQQRISGDRYYASPIAIGNKIVLASEAGRVSVVQAGSKYQLLATNDMGESCMATPAVSGKLLLIRTLHQLVAIRADGKMPPPSPGPAKSVRQFQKSTPLGKLMLRTAAVQTADLNADGHLDIVVANGRHWPEQNECFFNDGKGGFNRRQAIGNAPDRSYAVPLADLDGDGDLDLVTGNDRDPSVIYLNDGRGQFQQSSTLIPFPQPTRNATLADLNGDKHTDILIANRSRQNFFYLNDGKGGFSTRGKFGTGTDSTIAVAAADMNGDGHVDLVLANRDKQPNRVYFNNGQTQFLKSIPFGTGTDNTRSVALADINRDGQLDIIAANIGTQNTIYLNDQKQPFTNTISFGKPNGQTFCVTTGDLDRNGTPDIVIGNVQQPNSVYFTYDSGKKLQAASFSDNTSVTYGIAVGDLDGDDFPEVITANSNGHNYIFWNKKD